MENARRFRIRKKIAKSKRVEVTLCDKLMGGIALSSRAKRAYSAAVVEILARVGWGPSPGGARSPLAGIIRHVTGSTVSVFLYIPIAIVAFVIFLIMGIPLAGG